MILLAYGTRPEWIKLKPLIHEFDMNNFSYKILFTGQHKDLVKEFKPDYEAQIIDGENRLDSILTSIPYALHNILKLYPQITHVLVQGDTTSVLGIALSASHHGIKVIHLEAGLRTYDKQNPYPEETNRRIVSTIADVHLCPTLTNVNNLLNEKIEGNIFHVGNTVLDNLLPYKNMCEYTNKILITLHRLENHHWMDRWFMMIDKLAGEYSQYEFILPIHPNPNVQKHKGLLKHVKVVDPMSHEDLLNLLIKTRLVITDSGGIQEECSFFNKKCLTCRKVTERPEAIGQSTFMIETPEDLIPAFIKHVGDFEINYDCPFGDGKASEKIIARLKEIM